MARTEIAQCDICGAHASAENPMGATVTLRGKRDTESQSPYIGFFVMPSEPKEQLDLCFNCSAPLVHMLRDHVARRRQEKKKSERVKPANAIHHDAFKTILGVKSDWMK